MEKIIIYDGQCGFCNRSIQFILNNNPDLSFRFVSFQSKKSNKYLVGHHIASEGDSIIYMENNRVYTKSTAVLKILKGLDSNWKYWYYLIYTPAPLRNLVYAFISRNRYHIMGKNKTCRLLTKEEKSLFLD